MGERERYVRGADSIVLDVIVVIRFVEQDLRGSSPRVGYSIESAYKQEREHSCKEFECVLSG